jgi:hypothetical protein
VMPRSPAAASSSPDRIGNPEDLASSMWFTRV